MHIIANFILKIKKDKVRFSVCTKLDVWHEAVHLNPETVQFHQELILKGPCVDFVTE